MKRVSFEVAKAIKKAGCPQHSLNEVTSLAYDDNGEIWEMGYFDQNPYLEYYSIVTYIDVWLWLWREKKIAIGCPYENTYNYWFTNINAENDESLILWKYSSGESNDPEDAIIEAIEYLVNENLLK